MTPYIQQQLKKLCDNPNWYAICSSYGIKTQEIKGKPFITPFSCTTKWITRKHQK